MVALAPLALLGLGGLALARVARKRALATTPTPLIAPAQAALQPPPLLRGIVTIEDIPTLDKGGRFSASSLKPSAEIIAAIAGFEGFRDRPYLDSAGVLTIGYGHTNASGRDPFSATSAWSEPLAFAVLQRDADAAAADVRRVVKVDLSQGEFDALTSFVFNLGVGRLASSTLLRKLNAGDYAGAQAEFPRWTFAGSQQLAGLIARRNVEQSFFAG